MAKKKRAARADTAGASVEQEPTFEESLARLEEIVQALEQGNLGLEESLKLYEEGIARIAQCNAQLTKAERQIELLMGADEEGAPRTRPFDDESMSLEEKQTQRSRRRSID